MAHIVWKVVVGRALMRMKPISPSAGNTFGTVDRV